MTPRVQTNCKHLALCALALCAPGFAARAETSGGAATSLYSVASAESAEVSLQQTTEEVRPLEITVSRASDIVGRPMFAVRESFSQSAGVVAFSRTRPKVASGRAARLAGVPQASSTGSTPSKPRFYPLDPSAVTSGYGIRLHPILGTYRAHSGVDLAAPAGTPIAATGDGVVSFADWSGGYGLLVAVDHGGGMQTRYGHMSRIAVSPGQRVRTGDVLGFVGSTGLSTGPHVHYELRIGERAINPAGVGR